MFFLNPSPPFSKSASMKFQALDSFLVKNIPTQQANHHHHHHHHRGFHCDSASGKYCSALGIQAATVVFLCFFFGGGGWGMAKGRKFQVQCEAYMFKEVRKLGFLKKIGMLAWFVVSFEMVDHLEHVFLFRKKWKIFWKKDWSDAWGRSRLLDLCKGRNGLNLKRWAPTRYNWGYLQVQWQ